jgi:tetrahydromethanopterin S-methyltransferase subunit D
MQEAHRLLHRTPRGSAAALRSNFGVGCGCVCVMCDSGFEGAVCAATTATVGVILGVELFFLFDFQFY